MEERTVYSVSRLNRECKGLLEGSFPLVWVEGEISNLARPASGHLYFSLKDATAQVRCALFRGSLRRVSCEIRDGLKVIVRARISLYEARGDFQMIVDSVEDAGEGALRQAFETLKTALRKQGLFAEEHKKPIPRLPKQIGVITSPSGAVLHDIVTTLRRRFPAIPILVYPVAVQGEKAADQIVAALKLASARADCDVLLLARGGGSLEDLWPFNEERVAQTIFRCDIPIVCGVGHETDVTIADWVADARAPTPTAAAEMVSPEQTEWLLQLSGFEHRLFRSLTGKLRELQQRLDWAGKQLAQPDTLIKTHLRRIDELAARLHRAGQNRMLVLNTQLHQLESRLQLHSPASRISRLLMINQNYKKALKQSMLQQLTAAKQRYHSTGQRLHTLSPLATLDRGYAIVSKVSDKRIVRDAATVTSGDKIEARVAKGRLHCTVDKISKSKG